MLMKIQRCSRVPLRGSGTARYIGHANYGKVGVGSRNNSFFDVDVIPRPCSLSLRYIDISYLAKSVVRAALNAVRQLRYHS